MTPRVEATITGALFATVQGVILHFLSVESAVVGTAFMAGYALSRALDARGR